MILQEQEELTVSRQDHSLKPIYLLVDCCQGIPHFIKQSYINVASFLITYLGELGFSGMTVKTERD